MVPEVIVLGQYGRQRWESGTLTSPPAPPGVREAWAELPAVLVAAGAPDGTFLEDKGDAVAVHTRRTAEPGPALDRLRGPLAELAKRTGLVTEPGRMVIELRPAGSDKGQALKNLVTERNPSAVLYTGDDLGDRPAFLAVAELRDAGTPGLTVCSGSTEVTALTEMADLMVDGPAGLVALLDSLAAAITASACSRPGPDVTGRCWQAGPGRRAGRRTTVSAARPMRLWRAMRRVAYVLNPAFQGPYAGHQP